VNGKLVMYTVIDRKVKGTLMAFFGLENKEFQLPGVATAVS